MEGTADVANTRLTKLAEKVLSAFQDFFLDHLAAQANGACMSLTVSSTIWRSVTHLVAAVTLAFVAAMPAEALAANDCERFHDPRYVFKAYIRKIYDGDTINVDIDLGFRVWLYKEPLRLWGIDTPEVRGASKEAGIAVRDLVRSWVPEGTEVLIRTLKSNEGVDRTGSFHRYLAVICPLGWSESVNARLLREGKAEIDATTKRERKEILKYYRWDEGE